MVCCQVIFNMAEKRKVNYEDAVDCQQRQRDIFHV